MDHETLSTIANVHQTRAKVEGEIHGIGAAVNDDPAIAAAINRIAKAPNHFAAFVDLAAKSPSLGESIFIHCLNAVLRCQSMANCASLIDKTAQYN